MYAVATQTPCLIDFLVPRDGATGENRPPDCRNFCREGAAHKGGRSVGDPLRGICGEGLSVEAPLRVRCDPGVAGDCKALIGCSLPSNACNQSEPTACQPRVGGVCAGAQVAMSSNAGRLRRLRLVFGVLVVNVAVFCAENTRRRAHTRYIGGSGGIEPLVGGPGLRPCVAGGEKTWLWLKILRRHSARRLVMAAKWWIGWHGHGLCW